MNPSEAIAAVVVFGSLGLIGFTLAKAFAQRISGGAPGARELDAVRDEVAQLRSELDDVHARLAGMDELQNRVDFAERMLAQQREQRERGALGAGPER